MKYICGNIANSCSIVIRHCAIKDYIVWLANILRMGLDLFLAIFPHCNHCRIGYNVSLHSLKVAGTSVTYVGWPIHWQTPLRISQQQIQSLWKCTVQQSAETKVYIMSDGGGVCVVSWHLVLVKTFSVIYDHTLSLLANHPSRHKATSKICCHPGDCIRYL